MLQIPILDWTLADIMLYFQNDQVVAWVLILSGGLLAIWLLEKITDPIPLLGTIIDGLVHIGTFIGFFVGILDLFVGYVVWTVQPGAIIVACSHSHGLLLGHENTLKIPLSTDLFTCLCCFWCCNNVWTCTTIFSE